MIKRILMFFGWEGGACAECKFCEAAHIDSDIQWHPDFDPCDNFKHL